MTRVRLLDGVGKGCVGEVIAEAGAEVKVQLDGENAATWFMRASVEEIVPAAVRPEPPTYLGTSWPAIRPLHDWVLVLRAEPDARTPGGIIIPDDAQERPQRGEVLAVGPGLRLENGERAPVDVKPGDVVLFPKYCAKETVSNISTDPNGPVLIRASELLAVVRRE